MDTAVNREAPDIATSVEKQSARCFLVELRHFLVGRAFELRSFKYTTDVPLRETDL